MNCIKKIEKRWPKSDMISYPYIMVSYAYPHSRLGSAMHAETNPLDVLHLRERVSEGITITEQAFDPHIYRGRCWTRDQ